MPLPQLRECAAQEATLHQRMSACNDALTAAEIKLERSRDHVRESETELQQLGSRAAARARRPRPSRSS